MVKQLKSNNDTEQYRQANLFDSKPEQMTAQELKERGHRLFESHKYADAIPLLKAATTSLPKDEIIWQELVLAASRQQQYETAVDFEKQAILQHPHSAWLWRELGNDLIWLNRLDEAEKALNNARGLDSDSAWLWRYFVRLHQKRKDYGKEIEAWENLFDFIEPDGNDLHSLGTAYYNQQNYTKAIDIYRLSAAKLNDPSPFFNMGLAFSRSEVSQMVDAADAYRRALALKPDHDRGLKELSATKQILLPLAASARAAANGLIPKSDHFQFYLSPFEAMQLGEIENSDSLEVKTIQRAKKRLLQEIELNDGKVSWLDDFTLDKSRALTLEDELLDESTRYFHWAVFENKPLLKFLTQGEIEHFVYSDCYFPQRTLELLDEEPDFKRFLTKPFANQYNLVLTRAIEQRALAVIEVLFQGRRWVNREDEDICFAGAHKRVDDLVHMMRVKTAEGKKRKESIREMKDFLRDHSFTNLFNLLPAEFRSEQSELITEIRSLAIDCYNVHEDPDLSRDILNLCKGFQFKNVELNKRLEEDFKIIEQKITEERKAEVRLQFGPERPFEITKEGIKDGAKFFSTDTIRNLRWGITVTGYTGAELYTYILVVTNDSGKSAIATWSSTKAGEAKQTEHFTNMVNACMNYLAKIVVEKIQRRLNSGLRESIGPCTLFRDGIGFQTQGLLFKKDRFVLWTDLSTVIRNGQVILSSKSQQGVAIGISMKDTDNAVLLPILQSVMEK
ncbi:MAG: tetratricopeptide repeat protein [Syntrophales bacterium]